MRDTDRHRLRELDTLPLDPLRQANRMKVIVRKYGNSTVAVLPPPFIDEALGRLMALLNRRGAG